MSNVNKIFEITSNISTWISGRQGSIFSYSRKLQAENVDFISNLLEETFFDSGGKEIKQPPIYFFSTKEDIPISQNPVLISDKGYEKSFNFAQSWCWKSFEYIDFEEFDDVYISTDFEDDDDIVLEDED